MGFKTRQCCEDGIINNNQYSAHITLDLRSTVDVNVSKKMRRMEH